MNLKLSDLEKLKTVFQDNGTVTPGNSSGINDGAAALLIGSEDAITKNNLTPLARIVSSAIAGVEPKIMGIGPVKASEKALKRAGLSLYDMDIIELNEAFAAQGLSVMKGLGVYEKQDIINLNGGAIALGHPLGATGTKLMSTLLNELEHSGGRYGLQTMCEGGGLANVTIIERL